MATKQKSAVVPLEELAPPTIEWVPLNEIDPNPYQLEGRDSPADVQDLVESIKTHGMIETPVGRRRNGKVELASGHRRLAAHKILAEQEVAEKSTWCPGVMRLRLQDLDDQAMADVVIQENKKRQDIDAIAEARLYKRYIEDFGVTQTELAQRVGFSQAEISNTMRLLELPAAVQDMIISREITGRHGRELLKVKILPQICEKVAKRAAADGASVGELNRYIGSELGYGYKSCDKKEYGMDRPVFNTAPCRKCEHRVEYTPQYGDGNRSICANPECWKQKQREAEAKTKDERQQEINNMVAELQEKAPAPAPEEVGKKKKPKLGKLAVDSASAEVTKALDLDNLRYDEYESLGDYVLRQMDNPEECETCPKRVVAAWGSRVKSDPVYVCLKPGCVRGKKATKTKHLNKAVRDDDITRKSLIDEGLKYLRHTQFNFMADRDFLMAVLGAVLEGRSQGRYDRMVSKDYGLDPGDRNSKYPRVRLDVWLAEKSDADLAWILVRETLLRADMREQTIQTARLCGKIGQEIPTMVCRKCGGIKKLDRELHLYQTTYGATMNESQEAECYDCIQKGYREARGDDLTEYDDEELEPA